MNVRRALGQLALPTAPKTAKKAKMEKEYEDPERSVSNAVENELEKVVEGGVAGFFMASHFVSVNEPRGLVWLWKDDAVSLRRSVRAGWRESRE